MPCANIPQHTAGADPRGPHPATAAVPTPDEYTTHWQHANIPEEASWEVAGDDPMEDLVCPVCANVAFRAVSFFPCGHSVCEDCVAAYKTANTGMWTFNNSTNGGHGPTPNCFLCRKASTGTCPNYALRNIVAATVVLKCPWGGCEVSKTLKEMSAHVPSCGLRPHMCVLWGAEKVCGVTCVDKDRAAHRVVCPNVPVTCTHCGKSGPRGALSRHVETECSLRPLVCNACGYRVNFSDRVAHEQVCAGLVHCGPCGVWFVAEFREQHNQTCPHAGLNWFKWNDYTLGASPQQQVGVMPEDGFAMEC